MRWGRGKGGGGRCFGVMEGEGGNKGRIKKREGGKEWEDEEEGGDVGKND